MKKKTYSSRKKSSEQKEKPSKNLGTIPEFEEVLQTGSTDLCKKVLATGFDINKKSVYPSKTALHLSIEKGLKEICEVLLEAGADPQKLCHHVSFFPKREHVMESCVSPLMLAAFHGHLDICKLLLSKGVRVNASTRTFNLTALFLAAEKGFIEICQLLVENGANVNHVAKDQSRQGENTFFFFPSHTPLSIAIRNRHIDLSKWFISTEACDVNCINANGDKTPLYLAAWRGMFETCQLLISAGANVNPPPERLSDGTPLSKAAEKGFKEICQVLLKAGAKPGSEEERNPTLPLFKAAENGHSEICQLLIDAGFDVNRKHTLGQTPLHAACSRGHDATIEVLIHNKALLEETLLGFKQDYEETALWIAAAHGRTKACEILLKAGANVHKVNYEGKSPLYIAAEYGYLDVCKMLLRHSTTGLNEKTNKGKTALFVALKKGHHDVATHLKSLGAVKAGKVEGKGVKRASKKLKAEEL